MPTAKKLSIPQFNAISDTLSARAIIAQVSKGEHCRICGKLLESGPHQCTDHFLVPVAVELQNQFFDSLKDHPETSGNLIPRGLQESLFSTTQRETLLRCRIAFEQCKWSLSFLTEAAVELSLVDRIEKISEYGCSQIINGQLWEHFLYKIRLKNGEEWALDITGCQFGPDWPLVEPWSARLARFGDPLNEACHEIGHLRECMD